MVGRQDKTVFAPTRPCMPTMCTFLVETPRRVCPCRHSGIQTMCKFREWLCGMNIPQTQVFVQAITDLRSSGKWFC